jgi:metal-responsive CopG/Arc/MetJ family transcriptional regulator
MVVSANISMPKELLEAIDARAAEFNMTRSAFICAILNEELAKARSEIVVRRKEKPRSSGERGSSSK